MIIVRATSNGNPFVRERDTLAMASYRGSGAVVPLLLDGPLVPGFAAETVVLSGYRQPRDKRFADRLGPEYNCWMIVARWEATSIAPPNCSDPCPLSRARSGRQVLKNGHHGLQEGNRTLLALIAQDLYERDPRGIIDADMNELPTDTVVTVDCAGTSPSDAVAHGADPPEPFDIEMDEGTRALTCATARRSKGRSACPTYCRRYRLPYVTDRRQRPTLLRARK